MAKRKHLLHVKSNVAEEAKQYGIDKFLVTPKKPVDPTTGKATDDTLLYGEIAVNYGKGVEALIIRNTEDNVVAFINENDFYEAGKITAAALATEKMEREETVAAEAVARDQAIAAEALARDQAIAAEAVEREQAIAAEKLAREQAEFVTSNALTYLDKKIDTSAVLSMVSITYAEMKELRDQSKLKAGQLYRITDYVTTTTQENTQSAGHVFDVIVLATDANTLNENAKVIKHEGDTYFANSNLDAWEIKYDLDNDTTKYAWADETNGKGVIFYMKDEWNNECPYDFKNIQFKRWAITNITSTQIPTTAFQDINNTFNFNANGGKHFATKNLYGSFISDINNLRITVDETESAWYYTFNGMSSEDGVTIHEMYDISTKYFKLPEECLGFMNANGLGYDLQDSCYDNVITACRTEFVNDGLYNQGRMVLNNIVFNNGLSYGYYDAAQDSVAVSISSCHDNKFWCNCNSTTFGNSCSFNTIGNGCDSNTIGDYFTGNTFGDGCRSNIFGNLCWRNTFEGNCYAITLNNNCHYNTFGRVCEYTIFGTNCSGNIVGAYCFKMTFGNNNIYNIIGLDCDTITFGNYCRNNIVGNNCEYLNFTKDYMEYNIIENGNRYITVTSTQTTGSAVPLRNFTIAQGVNNGTTRKTISHDTTNDTFKTIYQNANSKTVDV